MRAPGEGQAFHPWRRQRSPDKPGPRGRCAPRKPHVEAMAQCFGRRLCRKGGSLIFYPHPRMFFR